MQSMHNIIEYLNLSVSEFTERKALIDLSAEEVALLQQIHLPLQQYESNLIDNFYQHLFQFEPLKKMLVDDGLLTRLKHKQTLYFRDLTAGVYDIKYAENRLVVGVAHEKVGLNTQWYIGAYGAYLTLACKAIVDILQHKPQDISTTLTALYKVALLDITLAFDAFMYANHQTLLEAKQEITSKFSYQIRLQAAINRIQSAYITGNSDESELYVLLNEMLQLSDSQYGLIADVKAGLNGQSYLKISAISDNIMTLDQQKAHKNLGLEFHQLDNLLGEVLISGQIVISNDLVNDPRSGDLYQSYLDTESFIGFPVFSGNNIINVLVLVNRPDGYDNNVALALQPVIDALEILTVARKTKHQLESTLIDNARLAIVAKQTINGVVITDTNFAIQWCNSGYYKLTGYEASEVIGKKPFTLQGGENTCTEKLQQLMFAVENLQPIDIDIIKYRKNRTPYWSRISCNPTYANDGQHLGFVLVELDTTSAHQQKDKLLHYKTVLDRMHDAVYFVDASSLNITYANLGAQHQLGMTEQQLLSLKPFEIKIEPDKDAFVALITPLLAGDVASLHYSTWHITATGIKLPVEVTMQLVNTVFGESIIINLIRDVSVQQQVEQLRNSHEMHINNLLQRSEDAIAIIDKSQRIIDCNQAALSLFNCTKPSELLGKIVSELGLEPHQLEVENNKRIELIAKTWQEGYQRFNLLYKTAVSAETPIELTLTPVVYKTAACLQVVWRDLTEVKEKERKVKQLAYFDELTGLANINLFATRLKYLLKVAKSHNYTIAVIYFDIIKLAEINETMGYKGGDVTIQAIAQRFSEQIRNADLALKFIDEDYRQNAEININEIDREFDALARIHADKFALAAVLTNAKAASNLTERIQKVIRQPLNIMGNDFTVSVRAGGALYPDDATDYEMLIRGANIALGYAKEQQQSHSFYNAALGNKVQRRALIFKRLEQELMSGQPNFSLRYQPQVDLSTGLLCGAEVLIRWFDQELGWITPDVFIPLAEERGLINAITAWVIEAAGMQLAKWQQAGYQFIENKNIKLAINISAKSLELPNVVNYFVDKITLLGLSPADFEVELTETGIMRDPIQAIYVLHQLKQLGFTIAIDDFGTGHSSLSYLKNINADILKIDMCFVKNMLVDKTNHAIVKTVIATAKIFGMQTLAEGVEEQAIADELSLLGCDYVQGYLYAKPLLAQEFEQDWLKKPIRT